MARVPRATTDVTTRPMDVSYQSASGATLDAFGGSGEGLQQTGRSIRRGANQLADVVLKAQIEDNERQAKELEIQYNEGANLILYGDGKDNQGFYSLQGQNALDAREGTTKALKKLREDLMGQAKNGRVKEMFGLTSSVFEQNNLEGLAKKDIQERKTANLATSEARVASAANNANLGYSDPKVVSTSIAVARGEALQQAEDAGLSEEATAALVKDKQSLVYGSAIEGAMAQGDTDLAAKMYNTYSPGMNAETRAALGTRVLDAAMDTQAQNLVDKVMTMNLSPSAARQWVRDNSTGKLENKTIDELNARVTEKRGDEAEVRAKINFEETLQARAERKLRLAEADKAKQDEQDYKEARKSATNFLAEGGSWSDWKAQNPKMFDDLAVRPGEVTDMMRMEVAITEGKRYAKTSDNKTFAKIQADADANPAQFVQEFNPEGYYGLLTEGEMAKATKLAATKAADIDLLSRDPSLRTNAINVVKAMTPELKWGNGKATEAQRRKQEALTNEMINFSYEQAKSGKKPKIEDLQKEAARLAMTARADPEGFWSTEDQAWNGVLAEVNDLSPTQLDVLTVDVESIPADLKARLESDISKSKLKAGSYDHDELLSELAGAFLVKQRVRDPGAKKAATDRYYELLGIPQNASTGGR